MSPELRELYRLMLKAKPVVNIRKEDPEYYIHLTYPLNAPTRENALFIAHFEKGSLVKM